MKIRLALFELLHAERQNMGKLFGAVLQIPLPAHQKLITKM
jgi:hypothetical protein